MSEALFGGIVGGIALAILGAFLVLIIRLIRAAADKTKEIYVKNKPNIDAAKTEGKRIYENITKSEQQKLLEIDNRYFEQANKEMEEENQDQGLWIKSLTLAEGDKSKQKSIYLKLRAIELDGKGA